MSKIDFSKAGKGPSALPVATEVLPAPVDPGPAKPTVKRPVAKKPAVKASVKAAPAQDEPRVTMSVTFSATDAARVIKELDGRPARSKLAEIILESMFGDKA